MSRLDRGNELGGFAAKISNMNGKQSYIIVHRGEPAVHSAVLNFLVLSKQNLQNGSTERILKQSAVKLEVSKAEHIFDIVLSADSNAGAYSHGEAAALGRLAAWHSLAELTGVRADGTFDDVAQVCL